MRNVVVPCCHVVLATIGIWSVRIDGMPDPAAKATFLMCPFSFCLLGPKPPLGCQVAGAG